MRAALDTNILVYAEDVNSPELGEAARRLVQRLPLGAGVIALQVNPFAHPDHPLLVRLLAASAT